MSNVRKWKRDSRRQIIIDHAELNGVTPAILAWWYGHVVGDMEYAGRTYPRYLVWHPLDHISYEIEGNHETHEIKPGTRLHLREAFQRNTNNLLDLHVTVERIDSEAATIVKSVLGMIDESIHCHKRRKS